MLNTHFCLATSADGIRFEKPTVSTVVAGTNIVVPFPLRSNNLWDRGPDTKDGIRYVIADTNGPKYPGKFYWLWGSRDGVSGWEPIKNVRTETFSRFCLCLLLILWSHAADEKVSPFRRLGRRATGAPFSTMSSGRSGCSASRGI
eukprot:SAG22_NODE_7111_length_775_cov_0.838757_1_plen_144_part_10